ncbi:MAG: type I methionyl aminopeptidase [Tuberibacillus sp.]
MIIRKGKQEIEYMREAGRIVALALEEIQKVIEPGITTAELDHIADRFIRDMGAVPSFKGYEGFPGSICTSVSEEIVHGIPGSRKLKNGDLISIDIGACYNGYHSDSAWTYPVGQVTNEAKRLLKITEDALYLGIEEVRPDARLGNISHAVQTHVESAGFSVIREFVGHGVGRDLHEDPDVPNYGPKNVGPRLKPGMVIAIEPMVNMGRRHIRILEDDWTVITADGKPSAHFEHTVAVTEKGYEILTRP